MSNLVVRGFFAFTLAGLLASTTPAQSPAAAERPTPSSGAVAKYLRLPLAFERHGTGSGASGDAFIARAAFLDIGGLTFQVSQAGTPFVISNPSNLGIVTTGTVQYGLGATGGSGTYTWNFVSGLLPPGVALRADTPSFFPANQQAGLIGVATAAGNYSFTLSATSAGQTVNQAFTLRVTGLNFKDNSLPDGFLSTAYTHAFTALNGANAVTFSPVTIPAGLTLSTSGALSGTPTATGFTNVTFTMSDGVDTLTRSIGLNVYAVNITSPGALPNATRNSAYTTTLTASGGAGGYTFAVTNGSLPAGLTLSGATISGTPTGGQGISWFYIKATDSNGVSYTKTMTIDVVGSPEAPARINVGNIDDPIAGDGFGTQIQTCCGGVAPFTWSATGLPAGLSIRSGSGVTSGYVGPNWGEIWGIAQTAGTYNVQVTVTDANGAATTLALPLHVSVLDHNPGLPNGTIGVPYSSTLRVIGGVAPYTVSQLSGTLPGGLIVNTANPAVAGTPVENGGFGTTLQFSDSGGNTFKRTDGLTIINAPPATISINDAQNLGIIGIGNYSRQLTACCVASYVWSLATGSSLPPGITLSAGGLLSGSATTAGRYTFLIGAADAANAANAGYRQFTLVVTPISITTGSLPFGDLTTPYTAALSATGGTGGLTWSLNFGNYLPPGLSLSAGGAISGTPTATGQTGFSVTVTDASNNTATRFYAIDVLPVGGSPVLLISNGANLGTLRTGSNQLALGATGGTGTYVWSLVSGTLPPGLALRTDTPSFFSTSQQAGLIGVAITPGNYAFTLSVSSGGGGITVQTVQQAFTLRITALNVKDIGLPDAFVGSAYTYTLTPLNGAAAVTFAANGALPGGMSLSSAGVLSGTPTTAGFPNVNFSITDGTDTVFRSFQLPIFAVNITTPGVLPNGTQNAAYSGATIVASGGAGGYTFTTTGGLPPGLALSAGGGIAGTITGGPGKYQFLVKATDSASVSYSKQMSIDVIGVPTALPRLNFSNVDDGVVGNSYGWSFDVCCGGTAPFTWSATGLPIGMSIRSGSGIVSTYIGAGDAEFWGVPQTAGNYPVQITVTDANGIAVSDSFTFHVSVLDHTPALPNGAVNTAYSSPLRVIGGTGPYTATQVPGLGTLPGGLNFNGASLTVSGTPVESGGFRPTYVYQDSAGNTLQRGDSFTINDVTGSTVNITTGSELGQIGVGSSYSRQLSVTGASSYNWATAGGALPAGITLSASGLLSGSATTPGTYFFVVSAADATNAANIDYRQFKLFVTTTPISITTGSLPFGNLTTAYNATLAATGGNGALTWSPATDNFLPQGLSLSTRGVISGTPTSLGQYVFTVTVTDGSDIASRTFFVSIYLAGQFPPLAVSQGPNFGTSTIGENQFALGASGGNGVYTWALTAGSLPPGMTLRTDTPSYFSTSQQAGLIGVATVPGTYNFTLRVTSGDAQTVTQAVTWKITGLTVKDIFNIPDAFLNTPYSHTFTALNNAGPVTWAANGSLPPGLTLSSAGILSGTVTAPNFYIVNLSVTDGVDTVFRSFGLEAFVVNVNAPGTLPVGLFPNATQYSPYSQTLVASGGTPRYTFSISGSLAPGLTLGSNGTLSGTTTGTGRYSAFITAADANNLSYTRRMSIDVIGSPATLPEITLGGSGLFESATFGNTYTQRVHVFNGGVAPFSWSATGLPPGMSIRVSDGGLSSGAPGNINNAAQIAGNAEVWGVPLTLGDFNVKVTVTDTNGLATSQTYPFHVSELTEDPGLSNGTIGVAYSSGLRILGGTGPYTGTLLGSLVSQVGGSLPAGLTFNAPALTVTGTPIEDASFSFTPAFSFADSAGHTLPVRTNFLVIGGGASTLYINNGSNLGNLSVNSTYSNQLSACCVPSYSWSLPNNDAPTGLTLETTGLLHGTASTPGVYTFLVKVVDASNTANAGYRLFTLYVSPISVSVVGGSLPSGDVGVAYTATLAATGNTGAVTWTLNQFSYLPPGLSLSTAGVISGTATAAGFYNFNVTATDASNNTFVRFFAINIFPNGGPPLNLPLGPFPGPFSVGQQLRFGLAATGGTGPYHYSPTPGTTPVPGMRVQDGQPLPTNFSSTTTGGYLGIVATPGTYNTSIRVTDSLGATFDRAISFTVSPLVMLSQFTPPKALVGSPYSFTLTLSGGSGNYVWTATGLPAGITLNSSGQLTGTPTAAGTFIINVGFADAAVPGITPVIGETLVVNPFVITDNPILPAGIVGTAYNHTFSAPGCTGCTWTISGAPAGLTLSTAGVLSGTFTGTGGFNSSFTVTATPTRSMTG